MNTDPIFETTNKLFDNLFQNIVNYIPQLILALIVLIAGLLLSWLIKKLIRQFIYYLDRITNEKLKSNLLSVDLRSSGDFISNTFFWIVLIFSVAVVTHILGLPILTTWIDGLINYLPNIIAAIIIVLAGVIAGKLAGDVVSSTAGKTGISNAYQLGQLVRLTIILISVIIAIDQIGIDILFLTNLLSILIAAMLFGASLAFGLGAKTSVSNILGSYYLQKEFKPGDNIQIENIEGVIVKISPTAVFIETETGTVMIPSKDFSKKKSVLIKKK